MASGNRARGEADTHRSAAHNTSTNKPHTNKPSLRDVLAGVSVALVLVPQAVAYAALAGLPPYLGLVSAALPPIAAAFLASSPYLQTGPVAVTSLLTFGALVNLAPTGSPDYALLASLLALLVGVIRTALGLLRMGVWAYLMSEPVLLGFTSASALLIVASQLPAALGLPPTGSLVGDAASAVTSVGVWDPVAVMLSISTIGIVLGCRRLHPLFPGVLVSMVAGLLFSRSTSYAGAVVGALPTSFQIVAVDLPWASASVLWLPALVVALVGFAEPAAIARTYAARERRRWSPDRELVSQGVANVVAGVSGGFPVGGSFSRTSLNWLAGATSRWSGAVTGLAVLAFLPFAWLLSALPKAVISGIVIAAVLNLVRVRPLIRLWGLSKAQSLVAYSAFLLTLLLAPHIERAVLIGVLLSVAVHLWRELRPSVEVWIDGPTLHLAPHGVLWFGSAPGVEQAMLDALAQYPGARHVLVHMRGLGRVDLTGALALKALVRDARAADVEVTFEGVPSHARRILKTTLGWQEDGE